MTKILLENKYEVNPGKGQDESHPESQNMPSQDKKTMEDTSVLEVQTVEQVEVSVQEEVRVEDAIDKGEEDARKVDEGKDKDDNPSVDGVNPLVF